MSPVHTPIKYTTYMDSISGINQEIIQKNNYISLVKRLAGKGEQTREMEIKALRTYKEVRKLKVIRAQLWVIVMVNEIKELSA
ncbi:MAG TPA: hypothetical protein VFD46_00990 [Chryseolinea sp.]|nr:hypothetical protein [Chryseolinea sp.]